MSEAPAPDAGASSRSSGEPDLRVFASASAIRKGRFLALLLLVNWGVMGVYVVSQGVRSLVGGLAFGLGLFALIGGLAYLRASRNAMNLPLIEIDEHQVRHRRFSSSEWTTLPLRDVTAIADRSREALTVTTRSGEREDVPWLAVADDDRSGIVERIERAARP